MSDPTLRSTLKDAFALHKQRTKASNMFLVEGVPEIRAAIAAKWTFSALFLCPEVYKGTLNAPLQRLDCPIYHIKKQDFARLAYREGSGGAIGLVNKRHLRLSELKLKPNPLILVLDRLEKRGNIGAVLRTAAATGIDAVIICSKAEVFHANTIRNSVGAFFIVPWVVVDPKEAQEWILERKFQALGLDPTAPRTYTAVDLRKGTVLVLGAEAKGLHPTWRNQCAQLINIPMQKGPINSLNVASTAAIVLYEALRQRSLSPS